MFAVIGKKPLFFVLISLLFLFLTGFLKWWIRPPVESLLFLGGGLLGIYFLDLAEAFFKVTPSPFRSIVFATLFAVVSFFIVTSSGSLFASGLVLSLYLTMILWQIGEWKVAGNVTSWYRMVAGPVTVQTQKWGIAAFTIVFLAETYLFVVS